MVKGEACFVSGEGLEVKVPTCAVPGRRTPSKHKTTPKFLYNDLQNCVFKVVLLDALLDEAVNMHTAYSFGSQSS